MQSGRNAMTKVAAAKTRQKRTNAKNSRCCLPRELPSSTCPFSLAAIILDIINLFSANYNHTKASVSAMPALLTIPLEVRDRILAEVVSAERIASHDPDIENRVQLRDVKFKGWKAGKNIMYEKENSRITQIPTLLVNHQLHLETLAAIKRLPTKHSYVLDMMFVDERWLCPTWLSVPCLSMRVDKVYAALRTVNKGRRGRAFSGGDGSPPEIVWLFYELLERFLHVGPVGQRKEGNEEKKYKYFTIKTLDIDVITPDQSTPYLETGYGLPRLISPRDLPRKDTKADEYACGLCSLMRNRIYSLLYMGYHTAEYGTLLYERIGKIRILLDGEVEQEWDIAEELKRLTFNNSFSNVSREQRPQVFEDWKKKAHDLRVKLGLPVLAEDSTTEETKI